MISSGFFVMLDPADNIACAGLWALGFCLLIRQIDVAAAAGMASSIWSHCCLACPAKARCGQ